MVHNVTTNPERLEALEDKNINVTEQQEQDFVVGQSNKPTNHGLQKNFVLLPMKKKFNRYY